MPAGRNRPTVAVRKYRDAGFAEQLVPDPNPNPATDLAVSGFAELANRLGT